jgi:hypothetical protein
MAAALAMTSGCIVVAVGAAGAGTVAYIRGELHATMGKDYERVAAAAARSVRQLDFALVSEQKDALEDVITARTGQDKRVVITVKREGDGVTSVAIRVGLVGNEDTSRAILAQINRDL